MKKVILFFVMAVYAMTLFSQVNSFKIDASKTYEDGKKTSYLTLCGQIDVDDTILVEEELESLPGVYKFSFYNSKDLSKCMFTSDLSIDEALIVDMIYDVIDAIKEEDANIDQGKHMQFSESSLLNNYYSVRFEINDLSPDDNKLVLEITHTFKDNPMISDVNYNNGIWELFSQQSIKPTDIEEIISFWGLSINNKYVIK